MDETELKKFWNYCKRYASRMGASNDAEDFAQEATLQKVNGRKAHVPKMFIDFMRQRTSRSLPLRELKRNEKFYYLGLDQVSLKYGEPKEPIDINWTNKLDRAVMILKYYLGYTDLEVGWIFGFTECRAHQIAERAARRIKSGE